MIRVYFDTNFLLRFYLDDVSTQANKARKMVEAAMNGDVELVADLVVVSEMVWVMDSFYSLARGEIIEIIGNLYQTPGISFLNGEIIPQALNLFERLQIDFTDAIIAANAAHHKLSYFASFDKKHMKRLKEIGIHRIESINDLAQ